MKAVQLKRARWALAIVLALMCAVVIALPTLATADEVSEKNVAGEAVDKSADAELVRTAGDEGDGLTIAATTDNRIDLNYGELTIDGYDSNCFNPPVHQYLTQLKFGQDGLSLSEGFIILGFEQKNGDRPTFNEADRTSDEPTTNGTYFMIVEGVSHEWPDGDTNTIIQGFRGIGYVEFSVEEAGYTPSTGDPVLGMNIGVYPNGPTNLTWNGQPQAPAFSIEQYQGHDLVEGTDYEVTYQNRKTGATSSTKPSDEGEYTLIVTGKGTYKGDARFNFGIYGPTSLANRSKCRVQLAMHTFDYTGKAINPVSAVIFEDNELVQGTDYEVSYADSKGAPLSGAPTAVGEYFAIVKGAGDYSGEQRANFIIATAYSLDHPACSVKLERRSYAPSATQTVASMIKMSVTYKDTPLEQGKDYYVAGYEKRTGNDKNAWTSVENPTEPGTYRVVLKAVEGGSYTGEAKAEFNIVDNNNPHGWTVSWKGQSATNSETPVVSLEGDSADPPVVEVTSPSGELRQEGVDYQLKYYQFTGGSGYSNSAQAPFGEGQYQVCVVANDEEHDQECGRLTFCVARPSNDLTKATITMNPNNKFTYANGASINGQVKQRLEAKLGSATLKDGSGFSTSFQEGSGALGEHTVYLRGDAMGNPNGTYYGTAKFTYGVWNEAAPDDKTRVDAKTGIKASGSTIAQSTNKEDKWVSVDTKELTGSELNDEAQKVETEAKAAGASFIKAYDIACIYTEQLSSDSDSSDSGSGSGAGSSADSSSDDAESNSWSLTSGLDLELTFPVDAEDGAIATISHVHEENGTTEVTKQYKRVQNGGVSVSASKLSQFVISVGDATADDLNGTGGNTGGNTDDNTGGNGSSADDNTGGNTSGNGSTANDKTSTGEKDAATAGVSSNTKSDTKATGTSSNTSSKSTTAKTGDTVLPMVIGGIVVIAVIAVIVLLVSRRRSQR